jgi:hypothetical protein
MSAEQRLANMMREDAKIWHHRNLTKDMEMAGKRKRYEKRKGPRNDSRSSDIEPERQDAGAGGDNAIAPPSDRWPARI